MKKTKTLLFLLIVIFFFPQIAFTQNTNLKTVLEISKKTR